MSENIAIIEHSGDGAADSPHEASGQLTVAERPQSRGPLADLRATAMSCAVETMRAGLAEFVARDTTFRAWLLTQLTLGVHYGVPPGISQSSTDPTKWVHKPSLYKAGAERVIAVMGLLAPCESDMDAWRQLGSPADTFIRRCKLISRATGEIVGEGIGARKVGDKKMSDVNAVIKMADKCARVDAVLNAYGLSDLFTQDTEDRIAHENPKPADDAASAVPRSNRATKEQLASLVQEWKANERDPTPDKWAAFVAQATGRAFAVKRIDEWTVMDVLHVRRALGIAPPPE